MRPRSRIAKRHFAATARAAGDQRRHLKSLVVVLGTCYWALGQTARAIEFYEQALAIAREIGDRRGEGANLGNLGICYLALGQTSRAIEYLEQALAIAREIGNRRDEGSNLDNLGNCYSALGQTSRAIEYYEQALAIFRAIGYRHGEGEALGVLAEVFIDEGRYAEAIKLAQESAKIEDEIGEPASFGYGRIALAHFYLGNLPAAREAAETARRHDIPANNHNVLALLGVIALRQTDRPAAQEAFAAAVQQAEQMLAHSAQNYEALDAKGLALSGLALCEGAQHVAVETLRRSVSTFRAARVINKDTGIVKRVLRLFDELAKADAAGILQEVRAAAAGE